MTLTVHHNDTTYRLDWPGLDTIRAAQLATDDELALLQRAMQADTHGITIRDVVRMATMCRRVIAAVCPDYDHTMPQPTVQHLIGACLAADHAAAAQQGLN